MRCLIKWALLATCLGLLAAPAAQAATCRVKTVSDGADAGNSGASWSQAMTLQAALADTGCDEIWVKGGLYKPVIPADPGWITGAEQAIYFEINRPLKLYGNFAGTESTLSQRDGSFFHRSILTGDLGDDDNSGGDHTAESSADLRGHNSHHVMVIGGLGASGNGAYTRENTVIDGFTITAGAATSGQVGSLQRRGGGLVCNGSGVGNQCSPTLRNLLVSGNKSWERGGGLYFVCNIGGTCGPRLSMVTVRGNETTNGSGGGMAIICQSDHGCIAQIFTSTLDGNKASSTGGALYMIGGNDFPASLTVLNVTITDNHASLGGALHLDTRTQSQWLGVIMWGNTAATDPVASFLNGAGAIIQNSLVQDGCPANTSICENVVTDDPKLTSMANFGGMTPTRLLQEGSAAIDHGDQLNCPPDNTNFPLDQRGRSRPFDGDGDGEALCDAGSIEMHNSPTFQVVNTTDDHVPPLNDGLCSLREAIINASDNLMRWPDCGVQGMSWTDSILFDPVVFADDSNATINLAGELSIHTSATPIPGALVIDGTRGDGGRVELKGGFYARVLSVDISHPLSTTRLYKLKISGGDPHGTSLGGGVYLANGALLIDDSVIDGNQANKGGGVYVAAGDIGVGTALTLRRTTVSGNTATGDNGGGVMVKDSVGPVRIDASTISGNTAGLRGGGLMVDSSPVWLDRSTVSGNVLRANPWGRGIGIYAIGALVSGDTLTINHSTIANNDGNANTTGTGLYVDYGARATVNASAIAAHSGDDGCVMSALGGGTSLTARYSLFEQGMSCVSNDQGNNLTGNPRLYGLNDNGGPTPSQIPRWVDSPLVDAVPCNLITDPDFDNSADQRGIARPQDGNRDGDASLCDIGAVEVRGFAHTLTVQVPAYRGQVTDNYAPHQIENCLHNCSGVYAEGYDLVLTATADHHSHFVQWTGDCSGTSVSLSVPMLMDKTCRAHFALDDYTVTASVPDGHGNIAPATQQVTRFGSANFSITPDSGYLVDSVRGDTCTPVDNGDGTWTALGIKEDCSVTASFVVDTEVIFRNGFE